MNDVLRNNGRESDIQRERPHPSKTAFVKADFFGFTDYHGNVTVQPTGLLSVQLHSNEWLINEKKTSVHRSQYTEPQYTPNRLGSFRNSSNVIIHSTKIVIVQKRRIN